MAKKKTKKVKKPSTRSLLAAWSKQVRERDGHACLVCYAKTTDGAFLNAHHLLEKRYFPHLKYELSNGVTLCVKHHKWSRDAAHVNPFFFVQWLKENRAEQYEWVLKQMQ